MTTQDSTPEKLSNHPVKRVRRQPGFKTPITTVSIASASSSTTTKKTTHSALFQALQRVKRPARSIRTLDELQTYTNTDNRPTVELRVVHVVEPAIKKTEKSIVHVFLCEAKPGETKEEMKQYGAMLSDVLKDGHGTPEELCALLVRATVWQAKMENLNFECGDVIRMANVSKIGAFRGLLQFNCSPEHIQKLY